MGGYEEEESNEGHEGRGPCACHEGHEGYEEEGSNEGHEGYGCHESHEGYEEEESNEGNEGRCACTCHEGYEGHEEVGSHESQGALPVSIHRHPKASAHYRGMYMSFKRHCC